MSLQKTNLFHFPFSQRRDKNWSFQKGLLLCIITMQCGEFFSNGAVSFSHENAGNAGAWNRNAHPIAMYTYYCCIAAKLEILGTLSIKH